MNIDSIQNGIVIDHITAGLGMRLYDLLGLEKLESARRDLIVMHPLPRVNEISRQVDDDPRACYFKQVKNGKFVRMALILMLLEAAGQ